jgi:tetratricopeptide (TPR) repeat protein
MPAHIYMRTGRYIHAVEASKHPERALDSAKRFEDGLVPGAGHLVHMPAHIYMRTGRYAQAVTANEKGAALDEAYIAKQNVQGVYPMIYYNHNLQFLAVAASMEGRSAESIAVARKLAGSVSAEMVRSMSMAEMVKPMDLWMMVRFEKWSDILGEPAPPGELSYTTGMWHYARGMAFLGTGKLGEVEGELRQLDALRAKIPPDLMMNLNSAVCLLEIASGVLHGELAAKHGKTDEAKRSLEKAIDREDHLRYDEPSPWYFPTRQALGSVLLAAKRSREAEAVYREDLKRNPENGWSLNGLARALASQGRSDEAAEARKRFETAWARADFPLPKS